MERLLEQFLNTVVNLPVIPPFLFFSVSVIGKTVVRAESLKDPSTRREAFCVVLTNGSQICLIALAVAVATAMARTVNLYYLEAVDLLILAMVFLVVYFIICAIECVFNDPQDRNF